MTRILVMKPDVPRDVRLAKELKLFVAAGHDVRFVGWRRDAAEPDRPVPSRFLDFRVGFANGRVALGYVVWGLYAFWQALRREGDVIHAIDMESAFPVALATRLRRRPFVYDVFDTFHLRHNFPRPVAAILRAVDRFTMKRAAAIVHVDENRIAGDAARWKDKSVVVMNAPDDVAAPAPPHASSKLVVLAAGYLRKDRGLEWLLDAIERAPDVRLLAIGAVVEPDLEHRLRAHPRVEYHPFMPQRQALELSRAADVVTAFYDPRIPIYRVASPNKVFDAFMLGRPIILNREAQIAQLVERLDAGYALPYGDVDRLAALFEGIAKSREAALEKGARGRAAFEREYSWRHMGARLTGLYDRIGKGAS